MSRKKQTHRIAENNAGGNIWYVVLDAKGYPVAQGDYALCRGACIQHDARIKGNVTAMTLKDVIGGFAAVLDKFTRRPEVKKGTSEAVLTVSAAQVINETALQNLKELIQPQIQDVLEMLILTNGARDSLESSFEQSEWDEAADDGIGNLFEKYSLMLSANWLGVATIDTRLHEKGAVEKLSESFAKEAWKILTYDGVEKRQKDSTAILADVGIAVADLKSLATTSGNNPGQIITDEGNEMTLDEVIAKLHDYCGGVFDEDEYRQNLELSYDDDDGLALGAMQRLGGDMPCVEAMRMAYFEYGDDLPVLVMQRLVDFNPSSAAEVAGHEPSFEEERTAPPAAVKKKGRTPKAEQPPAPGSVPRTVLALLKDHSSAKDQDLADGIGTSRATFNNYVNGKAQLIASADQRQFLVDTIRKHKEGLVEALRQLGEE